MKQEKKEQQPQKNPGWGQGQPSKAPTQPGANPQHPSKKHGGCGC